MLFLGYDPPSHTHTHTYTHTHTHPHTHTHTLCPQYALSEDDVNKKFL